jgi:hypothetical protein
MWLPDLFAEEVRTQADSIPAHSHTEEIHCALTAVKAMPSTIDVARTPFADNFSQPMSEFVAQKIFCEKKRTVA